MATAIDELLVSRRGIDLDAVRASTDLQQRHEAKYVLSVDAALQALSALDMNWQVLEVANRRSTAYHSAYFDSDEFGLFRDHVKGRRLRYKVRARRYGTNPEEVLEVKLKSGRGATDKRRTVRDGTPGRELTEHERQWVTHTVRGAYGQRAVGPLHHALELEYTRRTLVNQVTRERLTVDSGLTARAGAATVAPVGHAVVMEVKSVEWFGQTVRLLQHLSVRPLTFSKYCAALAALHPDLDQRARQRAQRSLLHSS